MASFTDKAPTFNPYVQQQPVEAMVQVGMYKQQQYDQGVQRIQDSYNSIAGLDIMKDTDRSYLKSKLSETTNKLKGFAAGDFSNSQLTNSITGMVNGIAKDENIRNSVYATQQVRKELSRAADAEKEGKSSIVNQWALNTQVSAWLSDGQVGSSFNGKYTPYTDVDAKLREVYEKIPESETHTENPFIRDVNGNTLYFSPDGKQSSTSKQEGWQTKIDQAMLTTMVKGKSSQKILDNFYTSLSADDLNQLNLNAQYHYRNVDLNTLKGEFTKRIDNKKQQYNSAVSDIALELATNKNIPDNRRILLQANLNRYADALRNGELDKELETGLKALNDPANADRFKSQIYTDNYLNNMSKDLATQSITQTYETNPYFQAEMDLKELKFKYDNAARDQANQDRMFSLNLMKFAWDKEKFTLEQEADPKNTPIFVTDGAIDTDLGKYSTVDLQGEITSLIGTKEEQDQKGGYGSAGQLGLLNAQYAPLITDSKLTKEQKLQFLNGLSDTFMRDPSSINNIDDPNVAEYLQKRRELNIEIARKTGLYDAANTHETAKAYDRQIEQSLLEQVPAVSPQGVVYTGKDALDFLATTQKFYTQVPQRVQNLTGYGPSTVMTNVLDTKKLEDYYKGTRQENLAKIYGKFQRSEYLTKEEEEFLSDFRDLGFESRDVAGKINNEKQKWQAEFIRERSPEAQSQLGVISPDNKKDVNNAKALAALKINQVTSGVGELDNFKSGQFNAKTAQAILEDKNASYVIRKGFDGNAQLEMQLGEDVQLLPMTEQELVEYFPNAAVSNPMNKAKALILSSPIHSTNLKSSQGADAGVSAYFSGYQIPNIANKDYASRVRMDIVGNPYNNGGPNDGYILQLYYCDDNGNWSTGKTRRYTTLSGIQSAINMVDENTINDVINSKK